MRSVARRSWVAFVPMLACHEQASVGHFDPVAGGAGRPPIVSPLGEPNATLVVGGPGDETTWDGILDDRGRIYFAGMAKGLVDLGAGRESVNENGTGFIASYEPDGQFRWARTFPATELSAVHHLAIHAETLWATGYFAGEMTVGQTSLDAGSAQRMVVWQLGLDGEVQQVRQYGADRNIQGWTVAPSDRGVLLGASYLGDLDLGQGVLGAGPINGDSALAFRLTSDGSEVTWSQSIPGESSDPEASVLCRSALELPGERVALVSSFTGTLAAPWQLDAQGASDALIATFEADGEPGWWRVIAGSEHAEATAALASGSRLAVVGRIAGQLVRPGGAREAWLDEVEALGGPDGFIAVLDTSGELQWARRIGGEGQDWLTELAIDDAGNYWATGHFEQSLPIGTQVLQSDGAADAFLVGFTPTGEVLGASHLAGSGPSGGVAIDVLGDTLLVVGQFEGELTTEADSFTSQGIDTVLRLWSPP